MSGLELRQATLDDVPAIAELAERHFRELEGRPSPLTAAELESGMTMPGRDPRFDVPLVEGAGRVLGSGLVVAQPPYREMGFGWLRDPTQPPDRQREVLRLLLEGFTRAAQQRVDGGAPGEARQVVGSVRGDDLAAGVFASAGFAPHRQVYEMEVTLPASGPLEPPAWPPGVTGRRLRGDADDEDVAAVLGEAFVDHDGDYVYSAEQVAHLLGGTTTRLDASFLAIDEESPVGALVSADEPEAGYVIVLGVRRRGRGRGVGLALLRAAFAAFQGSGQRVVRLHVQAQNRTGAVRLYERAGMHPAVISDEWARPLPPAP